MKNSILDVVPEVPVTSLTTPSSFQLSSVSQLRLGRPGHQRLTHFLELSLGHESPNVRVGFLSYGRCYGQVG